MTDIYVHHIKVLDNFDRIGIIEKDLYRDLEGKETCGIPIMKGFASQSVLKPEEVHRKAGKMGRRRTITGNRPPNSGL